MAAVAVMTSSHTRVSITTCSNHNTSSGNESCFSGSITPLVAVSALAVIVLVVEIAVVVVLLIAGVSHVEEIVVDLDLHFI